MKTTSTKYQAPRIEILFFVFFSFFTFHFSFSQNVGINTTGAAPNSSALLDVDAAPNNNKGLLLPRMNTAERDAIASPANGLVIYNTDCARFNWYTGSEWKVLGAVGDAVPGAAGTISGSATVCQGQTGVAYTISAVSGASGYVWTYTGTGFSIASGANTNAITADFSVTATSGDLTVYATNACESGDPSPVYSITVDELSPAPVATAATNLAGSSFDANWDASAGATTYYLDVSTASDFSSFVGSYNNLDVGAVLTYGVVGLTCNTTYYYRVRAGNTCGSSASSNTITATTTSACWTCGDPIVDARDGKTYNTVLIGTQCWLAQNMDYDQSAYGNDWCYNNDCPTYEATYGRLYDWAAIMQGTGSSSSNPSGVQGVCPTDWHVPSDAEWKQLEMELGMTQAQADGTAWRGTDEGGKLKQTGTTLWNSPNTGATNSSGFTALPGGYFWSGAFTNIGLTSYLWSATESGGDAWARALAYNNAQVYRGNNNKAFGKSVRCVKD